MNNQRLISFDIQADFGFFKKPDYNDGVLLTYNMLHKPALLGILGAITALGTIGTIIGTEWYGSINENRFS